MCHFVLFVPEDIRHLLDTMKFFIVLGYKLFQKEHFKLEMVHLQHGPVLCRNRCIKLVLKDTLHSWIDKVVVEGLLYNGHVQY